MPAFRIWTFYVWKIRTWIFFVKLKGKEINTVGTRTVNINSKQNEKFSIGDLVAVTDLSHSMMDKMTGKDRDESKDFQFEVMGKIKPVFNADKMDFERWILKNYLFY